MSDYPETPKAKPMPPAQLRMRRPSLLPVKQRIGQGSIKSTAALIEALNAAETPNKAPLRRWLRQYISWFRQQPAEDLRAGDLEELATLVMLDPAPAQNKALLQDYLALLCNKTKEQGYGDQAFMQLLHYSLQTIDPSVFEQNPKMLIDLGHDLLGKLNPQGQKQQFTQNTYGAYEPTLYALHQTLVLIGQIDPESLDTTNKDSLYAQFRERLESIKKDARNYAFTYQIELLLQGLERLGTPLSKTQKGLRTAGKVLHGLKGGYHLYRVLRGLVSLKLKGEDLGASAEHLKKFFMDERLAKRPWYELLQTLSQASLVTSGEPPKYEALQIGLEALEHLKISQKNSRLPLHYGVVKLLAELALHSPEEPLRQQAKAWLERLSTNKQWTKDKEVQTAIKGHLKTLNAPTPAPVQPSERVFAEVVQSVNKEAGEAEQYSQVIPPMREADLREQLQTNYKSAYGELEQSLGDEKRKISTNNFHFNLSVVKNKKEQGQQDKTKKDPKDQIDLLHTRKQQANTSIQLEDLFKDPQVQRASVEAPAGMGKTTLSQKFAYQWAQGQRPTLKAVYLLPVRNLKKELYDPLQTQDHPLARAIAQECFPKLGSPEAQLANPERFESLVKRIAQDLEDPQTVVLLDGLDEREGASELLLKAAWRGRHKLVVTSRSYGLEEFQGQVDLEVALLGLTQTQIADYVRSYLQDETKAQKLLQFLQQHPSLGPMVQVPVTLNMVCALWNEDPQALQSIGSSRTTLYQTLTEYIWERYDQKHPHKELQNEDRDALFETLGQIALAGMEAGEALISATTLKKALKKAPKNKRMQKLMQGAGLLENMQSSRLITSVGPTYAFPHLTFQEYFAGKTLAKMLLEGSDKVQKDALKVLKTRKYQPSYRVMLTFMAGEVYEAGGITGAQKLLRALDENKEILGLQHILLQLRCLNEWLGMEGFDGEELNELEKEFGMLKTFNEWLRKGIEEREQGDNTLHKTLLGAFPGLGSVLGKSEAVSLYTAALGHKSSTVRSAAVEALGEIAQAAPEQAKAILPRLLERLEDTDAVKALVQLAQAAPEQAKAILPRLLEQLKDKSHVRRGAVDALAELALAVPEQAKAIVPKLLEKLKDEDEDLDVRRDAMKALAEIAQASTEQAKAIVPSLLEKLSDEDWYIRREVVEDLGQLALAAPEQAKEIASKLLEKLGDEHEDVRHNAVKALEEIALAYPEQVKGILPRLLEQLKDKSYVRRDAVDALRQIVQTYPEQAKAIVPKLLEKLSDEDWGVRCAAVEVLRLIAQVYPEKAKGIVPRLLEKLGDKNKDVRYDVVQALGRLAQAFPEQAEVIFSSLQNVLENDNSIDHATVKALGRMAQAYPEKAKGIVPSLLDKLNDKDEYVRRGAVEALGEIAQTYPEQAKGIVPRLLDKLAVKTLGEIALAAPEQAKAIVPRLLDKLNDMYEDVCHGPVKTLGEIALAAPEQAKAIVPKLLEKLSDEYWGVRRDAVKALGRIALVAPEQAKAIVPSLLEKLSDKDKYVREYAVEILVQIAIASPEQAKAIVPRLLERLGDKNEDVRNAAKEVLAALPTRLLVEAYLSGATHKTLELILRDKLYQEPLVIRPGLQPGEQELVIYSGSGKPIALPINQKQAERLRALLRGPVVQAKDQGEKIEGGMLEGLIIAQNSKPKGENGTPKQQEKKKKSKTKKKYILF